MKRRTFLKSSAYGIGALALASIPASIAHSCSSRKAANCSLPNISFQEGKAPGESLNEQFDYMEELGVTGFEPGGYGLAERVGEIRSALSGRNIRVSAICAGFEGFILSEDEAVRGAFDSSMRRIIAAAGELESTGVIMVPAFNGQLPCMPHTQQTRDYLVDALSKLGEYALECGTNVILEPLNRNEAFYLRQVADAAAICRDSNCKGVKCMGDFWHMSEETSDYAAFMAAGTEYLQHVHIASRATRNTPGEDGEADNYTAGFKALKEMGYDKYISFECGCATDPSTALPAAVELIRKQWQEA